MKKLIIVLLVFVSLLVAGQSPFDLINQKRSERLTQKRLEFEVEQNRIRALNGWLDNEQVSSKKSRAEFKATLVGKVLNHDNTPAHSMHVSLYDEYGHYFKSTETDSLGNYQFTNLNPMRYSVAVIQKFIKEMWHGGSTDPMSAKFILAQNLKTVALDDITLSNVPVQSIDSVVIEGVICKEGSALQSDTLSLYYVPKDSSN